MFSSIRTRFSNPKSNTEPQPKSKNQTVFFK
jgi:hypothetical protein